MAWPEEIAHGLPAPRDDEPAALRQDIADELADHLHCALSRELLRTGDEKQAKQNVLERFGDVNAVARRLWLEWMKEKIMSQRILIAAAIVMAVSCIAVGAMTWRMAETSRATTLLLALAVNAEAAGTAEKKLARAELQIAKGNAFVASAQDVKGDAKRLRALRLRCWWPWMWKQNIRSWHRCWFLTRS